MAQDAGFHDVKYIGKWNGCDVFEPYYTDDIVRFTGFPQFVIIKRGKPQWTDDDDESRNIMRALEKARVIDPFGHVGFDPSGKIRLTP